MVYSFYTFWNVGSPEKVDTDSAFYRRGKDDRGYSKFSNPSETSKDIEILKMLGIPESLQDGIPDTLNQIMVVTPKGEVVWQQVQSAADLVAGFPSVAWTDLLDSPGLGKPNQFLSTAGGTLAWVDAPQPSLADLTVPPATPAGSIPVVKPDGTTAYEQIAFTGGLSDTPNILGGEGQVLTVQSGAIAWTNPASSSLQPPANTNPGAVPVIKADGSVSYELPTFVALSDTPSIVGSENQVLLASNGKIVWGDPPAALSVAAPPGSKAGSTLVAAPDGTSTFRSLNFTELNQTPDALGKAGQILKMNAGGSGLTWADSSTLKATPLAAPGTPAGTIPVVKSDGTVAYEKPTFVALSDTPNAVGTEGTVLTIQGGTLTWLPVADAIAAGGTTLAGDFKSLTDTPNTITPGQVLIGNTAGNGLEFSPLSTLSTKIANSFTTNSVAADSIKPGSDDQVLTTKNGAVVWADADVNSANITNAISENSLAVQKLQSGNDGQVLGTVGTDIQWVDKSSLATSVVTSISNSAIAPTKLTPGTAGQVLTTSTGNQVEWATPATGVDSFVALTDTVNAFTAGDAGKPLVLNAAGNQLEFGNFPAPPSGAASFTALDDTPNSLSGQAGKALAVNAASNALEFVTIDKYDLPDSTATGQIAYFSGAGDPSTTQKYLNTGAAGQLLTVGLSGLPVWADPYTPDAMKGATATAVGEQGEVPQPAAGDQGKVLKGDGTWKVIAGSEITYDKSKSQVNATNIQDALDIVAENASRSFVPRTIEGYRLPPNGQIPLGYNHYLDKDGNYKQAIILPAKGNYVGEVFLYEKRANLKTVVRAQNTDKTADVTVTVAERGAAWIWNGLKWMSMTASLDA